MYRGTADSMWKISLRVLTEIDDGVIYARPPQEEFED